MVESRLYLRETYVSDSLRRRRRASRSRMHQITIRIEDSLYRELKRLVEEHKFPTLSEAIRFILRSYLHEVVRETLDIPANNSLF
ncbi:MAG: hypothetical protein DRJ52_07225 [Thermoprotei archaeon]|nr:MAG: hypothetical protein DRJ52_07225 [Thermoprotei archaeon]